MAQIVLGIERDTSTSCRSLLLGVLTCTLLGQRVQNHRVFRLGGLDQIEQVLRRVVTIVAACSAWVLVRAVRIEITRIDHVLMLGSTACLESLRRRRRVLVVITPGDTSCRVQQLTLASWAAALSARHAFLSNVPMMVRCLLTVAGWRRLPTVKLPVQVTCLHLLLDERFGLGAVVVSQRGQLVFASRLGEHLRSFTVVVVA